MWICLVACLIDLKLCADSYGRGKSMFRKITGFVLIVSALVSSGGAAVADDFHYTNLLVGDRASGMGGAYTAVSDDATGLYYNPAGVAYTTGRNMSASVNAYYDNEKTYKSVIGGNGWTRHSSSLLPNYFGVVQPLGKFKVGFSYAVPDSIMEDQSQTFHNLPLNDPSGLNKNPDGSQATITSYIINFNNESNVYNLGPSVAMELSDNFSVGLTLYYYDKKTIQILNQIIKTSNGGSQLLNGYLHSEQWGFRPILGFMWSPASNVSAGLTVSKVFVEGSSMTSQNSMLQNNIISSGVPSGNITSLPDAPLSSSSSPKYPTQIGVGVAWFPTQSLLFSGDINYYTKVAEQNLEAVTNFAVGTEYYLDRNWALRGGLYTNYANSPTVKTGGVNQDEHIDLYGGTASISHFTRNTVVTLGGGMTYGTGKAQIVGDATAIQTADSRGWMLFLSSSYSY